MSIHTRLLFLGLLLLTACGSSGGSSDGFPEQTSSTTTQLNAPPVSLTTTDDPGTPSSSSSTLPTLASSSCAASDLPPPGNPVLIVENIAIDDPDQGLNIRNGPSTSEAVQFSLANGTTVTATGLCELTASGRAWWEVQGDQWSGWASSQFLGPFNATAQTACAVENFDPVGKGTVERILADVDGNGSTDTIFLSYDGAVVPPNAWTGSNASIQIQYGDGGLSYELDIAAVLSDGGPGSGISQMPGFPYRIDPVGSTRSLGVVSSHFAGSATGAGQTHIVGELNCSPTVIANLDVNPSAGNPMRPILCDVAGRSDLFALEGIDANGNYLATEFVFQGSSFTPQGQKAVSSQGLTQSADEALCQ